MASVVATMSVVPRCAVPTKASGQAARSLSVPLGKAAPSEWARKTVQNGMKVRAFQVWRPTNNKYFETFSYLPPLRDDEVARQVDYITGNGWIPCLEFAESDKAYVESDSSIRFGAVNSGYQDNRYWTMWKLPLFGCTDSGQVLREIQQCTRAFPDSYIRLVAFDNKRQVQVAGMLVHRPPTARDYRQPMDRSVA
eukprot:jgi/Botrbrau1/20045/Bobra.200_1s0050.1